MFYPKPLIEKARANAVNFPWAAQIQQSIIAQAQPWLQFSDDPLWDMMFGNTITRSWMVWSNGHCPACRADVPMYNWRMDALKYPWKVRCPHCEEFFPKNDFEKFYRSGLDAHSVFDPKRADRTLLFNVEHPAPDDPLHRFGVDDGEGYVEDDRRWRFIGAYLIYGQWKQLVLGGVKNLSAAYLITGDPVYAHKAGVLLDRIADLYPTFDFGQQGIVYEEKGASGYVSTWHDACEETRELALAYDQVADALRADEALVAFLSSKARAFKLDNPKASFEDIQRNIEDGILRDALKDHRKIYSNYPREETTRLVIQTILGWPHNRDEVYAMLDAIIEKAVAVDGVTGEKGLTGYSTIGPRGVAELLGQFARLDSNLLRDIFQRHPRLHQMFRFHVDTWCMGAYYPTVGDCGGFAQPTRQYMGASFSSNPGLGPSMYTFFWHLYQLTGDVAFVQVLYRANNSTTDGLPYDLFADDPAAFQQRVNEVIAEAGTDIAVGSVNKAEWHLAILRSGQGATARALWLHYDSGGRHSHADGMNFGLFAKGLDLMPDLGYPPVQYGGWSSPRAKWYTMTASHNTVVVDGRRQRTSAGKTTLWADGERFRAIRASGAGLMDGRQFERTVALIDISEADSYILDVFRVIGGNDHAKFIHSHFGEITTEGLHLTPAEDYGHRTQMRNFHSDRQSLPGWRVDWRIDDRYQLLPPGADVHLRYTDLTTDAEAFIAEGWVSVSGYGWATEGAWIPRIMVRRRSNDAPLASTFVAVIEPYEKTSKLVQVRRLQLETEDGKTYPDANVAVEIQLDDGRRDLLVAVDVENPLGLTPSRAKHPVAVQPEWNLQVDGALCWVRLNRDGAVERMALCRGRSVRVGDVSVALKRETDFIEVRLDPEGPSVVSGNPAAIEDFRRKGQNQRPE